MKPILLFLFLFFSTLIFGQEVYVKRRSIFFEIAGSGGFGSFNYEKHFCKRGKAEFTWRVGFSIAPIDKNNGTGIVFPLMINTLIGKSSHKLELGLGQGITVTTRGALFALTTAVIGYRYQSDEKKWFYRVSYTPLISYLVDFQIQQWAGISIGYTFNTGPK